MSSEERGREVWIEKYRPQSLEEIHGQERIVERLKEYVRDGDMSHMLFAGPAGVGKCVTGETPVLTDQGVARIEDVVGGVKGFAEPTEGLEVLTFAEDGDFEYVEPSHLFGKTADELVRVETRDGNEQTVTPEHKLLVLGHDGLEWKPAERLSAGDRVVRPLRAPLPEGDGKVPWVEAMDGDRTLVHITESFAREHDIPAEEEFMGKKKRVVAGLRRGDPEEAIAEAAGTTPKTVEEYRGQVADRDLSAPSTVCSLSYLRGLDLPYSELEKSVTAVQYVNRNNDRSEPVTPPGELTPALGTLVGLAVSEARIDSGRIKFCNSDDGLLERFESAVEETFELTPREGEQEAVPYREIGNQTVAHLLESCFGVIDGATGGPEIGTTLVTADGPVQRAFLRAVFDAEAHVTADGVLELTQKNGALVTLVTYLLAGQGVPSRRTTERKTATNSAGEPGEYHTLYVSGARAMARFEEAVGVRLDEKAEGLQNAASRNPNSNDDTIPAQSAVGTLCDRLYLTKTEHVSDSLNPETPGRAAYLDGVDGLLDAASARIERAQQALERVDGLEGELDGVAALPAACAGERSALEPLGTHKAPAEETGVGTGRLLEYAQGRYTPTADRAASLLDGAGAPDKMPPLETVREELRTAIGELGVPYNHVAEGTGMRGTDVINLLEEGHSLRSLPRFETVAERVREVATGMLSGEVLEALRTLHVLTSADLYFDEVESVETIQEERRVYDLTVPDTHNYVAGAVPTVMHNTTSAVAIAKETYGDEWRENFLELNASDERGIDVVRDRIKNFARASFGGFDYRIVFLDEADALCVPPGTEVVTGYPSSPEVKPIEDVAENGESIPSVDFETNEIQPDKGRLVDSGVADFFELELTDGRTVTASLAHPFFVVGDDGELVEKELRELAPGDEIADFRDDVGVSRCKTCGDLTAGRFCSVDCKNERHSNEVQGDGNPMYGTEWSEERREEIVEKLSDGRFAGDNNPNHGGEPHGVSVWEIDQETVEQFRETLSEMRSGISWEERVAEANSEAVKEKIGQASSDWWELGEEERSDIIEKTAGNCDYPVCTITGDNNPARGPEVTQKVSEAPKVHEPTGGANVRHSDELGHIVRSDWEYEIATALQNTDIDYEYEPEFELSDSVYHPDFLVGDTVIEVKGVVELWSRPGKVKEFLERYGDEYTVVVVGGELPHHEHYEEDEFEPALVSDGGLRTVRTAEIRRIEYSHRGKAYNISMEGTPNFMLANGILTHNTSDAQGALRRTMEQFSNNARFILSCNYSSRIIDPIQSRCAVFRFSPLSDEAVAAQVREIADDQGIELTEDGLDALVYAAGGDMRAAINGLQAVFAITSTARPEEIREMVELALEGDFAQSRSRLDSLLREEGIAGGDIIDQLHRSVWEFDLTDREAVRVMERVGEADYRITSGASEQIQLEALLASLATE